MFIYTQERKMKATKTDSLKDDKTIKGHSYILPKESPWIVTVDGIPYNVQSHVCRLLLQLEAAAKKKAPAKKKK
jgi:hypothetical protein